jgi:tetratricopeptide (TPR) repeat protein
MPEELFRSDDLLVRKVGGHGGACCVVTFDSFTDFRTLERTGFGEAFLAAHGIDAIHVIPRDNDWYQYAEMADAMACVRAAARGYQRVVTYGSSMGAYAAIRLAPLAGAHAVLALSPQYSIDPTVVPWEQRWAESSARFRRVWEQSLPFERRAEAYIVYDPRNPDRRHADLFARHLRFARVAVPGGGHPVTGYLAEVGLLQEMILAVCRGPIDARAFANEARARRGRSAQYLLTEAMGISWRRRARRIALMREAVRLAPDNPGMISRLGLVLARAGQFDEAIAMHRRSLELAPGHPNMLFNFSLSLERSGDIAAALAAMQEASDRADGAVIYRARLEDLRARAAPGERRTLFGEVSRAWVRLANRLRA